MLRFFGAVLGFISLPSMAFAYDSLITATTFDTLKADVNATAIAVITVFMIIAAVGFIIRGLMGR